MGKNNSLFPVFWLFPVLLLTLMSCGSQEKEENGTESSGNWQEVTLKYAQDLKIEKRAGETRLTIFPEGSESERNPETFRLVSDSAEAVSSENAIPVPCKKIVCLSSTQLAYFFELEDIDDIVGINSSRYLFHEEMNRKVESGEVKRVGKEGNFNLETIAALDPDVIFVSPFKTGGYDALLNMGFPLVPMAAFSEKTPLGRAEWIKMMALFVGREEKADSLFQSMDQRYTSLKEKASEVEEQPTVFSGKMRSGSWYVPGGDSFYAHFFRDAGAEYVIKDDEEDAYPTGFETIYEKAADADFWRVVHPEKRGITLEAFLDQDSRYSDFNAAREDGILLCNIRKKPYYEQAPVKPHMILADYIYHFHPALLPDYEPCFYEKLK
ncbi:MAG: ABC transporter substrate-binding protein [Bacteroidota bacterium]